MTAEITPEVLVAAADVSAQQFEQQLGESLKRYIQAHGGSGPNSVQRALGTVLWPA